MIKILKNILFCILFFANFQVFAQTTTSSPYSGFGLGDLKGSFLPQSRAIGGLSMGIRKTGGYNNINLANPASYSAIQLTTFDIGAYLSARQLSKGSLSENNLNGTLSHVAFAIPLTKTSALSFGLLPFSDFGYQYKNSSKIGAEPDISNVNYVYSGNGGLSKAYLGYGFQLAKGLSLGANINYVFGNIKDARSTEFPDDGAALNSRTQNSKSIGGLSYDLGIQYSAKVSSETNLTIGYTSNLGTKLNSTSTIVSTRYFKNFTTDETLPVDTTFFAESAKLKLSMPITHTLGFAFEKTNKWLVGADVTYSNWADYSEGDSNPGLNNSYGVALGTQFTPDATSVSNYFKLIDYRFGLKYDKTFIKIADNDIDQYAFTFGLGLPLQSNRSTFYKINVSAELGQRGTLSNNLVRDRYVNINLGFTLNDRWFIKSKFD
ncbi:MAG: hypothetical protein WBP45_01160 [Daejeonella sp.]